MPNTTPVVHSDPEILDGTPVFQGTRVPFRNLIDYLERGYSLEEFGGCLSLGHARAGSGFPRGGKRSDERVRARSAR